MRCEATKHRFSVADDIGLSYFGDPYTGSAAPFTLSPNGQYFVVDTQRGLLDQNRAESTLRVFRTADVQRFLLHPELTREPSPVWVLTKSTYKDGPIISHIRWLTDSSGVAFLAKTAEGNDQLCLGSLQTKTVQPLTPENQHVTGFDIRDRRHFVYSVLSPVINQRALEEGKSTSVVGTGRDLYGSLFPENLYPFMSRFHDLSELWAVVNGKRFRVDSKSNGQPVYLHWDGQSVLALSPDGRSVVTAVAVSIVPPEWETLYPPALPSDPYRIRSGPQYLEASDGYRYVSEYVWIQLSTGKMKPLTNAPIGRNAGWWSGLSADWSSDGESVVLLNTFLFSNAHVPRGQTNRPCVAIVDLVKGNMTCLEHLKGKAQTKSGYEDGYHYLESVRFDPSNRAHVTIHYWEDDSKRSTSYIRSNDGLWTVSGTMNGWTEQDHAIEINVKESFTDPPVLLATDKTTETSRVILDPNPQLENVDLGSASVYKWQDKNGRDWVGGLYEPPDYVPGQRYPLVLQTHGFSETIFRPDGIFPTAFAARELAAAGILVLQVPNCPYTVDPAEGSCNVVGYEAAVQQLVKDGLVDSERVGIIGFSRTCYYVMEALTTSLQPFKAASITDGFNFGYLQYITNVDRGGNGLGHESEGVIGTSPFGEGLQQWFKRSPEFNTHKITTPLQVVALGPLDVLFMWEPYAALRYLNKPVDLIVLRQGTHVLTNPAERMVSQGGTVDWFRFWLKGEEDTDLSKSKQYTRWREMRKLQVENDAKDKAAKEPAPVN